MEAQKGNMSATLHSLLKTNLVAIVTNLDAHRTESLSGQRDIPSDLPTEFLPEIKTFWDRSNDIDIGNRTNGQGEGSSHGRRGEMIRSTMDLIGRDIVIMPIVLEHLQQPKETDTEWERTTFQTRLRDRLDVVLTLYEYVYMSYPDVPSLEPGAIFIPLLEELVELLSVETWRDLWDYVETRSRRFTKDMPASKGKALPLLRTINAFLRFLPRTPEDLVFRGRVHQFASSVIGIADKSAINMRGDNGEVKTTWEESESSDVEENIAAGSGETGTERNTGDKEEADGDVKMESEVKEDKNKEVSQPDFYSTLWSLQQYFSSPPSLAGPAAPPLLGQPPLTPFEYFKSKSDFVLPKLFEQTQKEKERMGKEGDQDVVGKKRKRIDKEAGNGGEDGSLGGFFHPRYLTGKRLLEHELADPSFRRQILVQYFILFQFLLNLTPASIAKQAFTGGMPKDFVIDPEKETWVKSKISSIREELRKMVPDGQRFEEIVLSIIGRERHYAQWKNEGCPEKIFEIPPMDTLPAKEAAQTWKKRIGPPPRYPFPLGSRSLSRLWSKRFVSMDQLKGWKRSATTESLSEEIRTIETDEQDDKAMGIETDPDKLANNAERKTNLNWRAIRLASRSDLRHFTAFSSKRIIFALSTAIEEEEKRRVALLGKSSEGKGSESGGIGGEGGEEDPGGDGDGGEKSEDEDVVRLKKSREGTGEDEGMKGVMTAVDTDGEVDAKEKGDGGTEGEDAKTNVEVREEGGVNAQLEMIEMKTTEDVDMEAKGEIVVVSADEVLEGESEEEQEPEQEEEREPMEEQVEVEKRQPIELGKVDGDHVVESEIQVDTA